MAEDKKVKKTYKSNSVDAFLKEITPKSSTYLKKGKSRTKIYIWTNPNERTYYNVYHYSPPKNTAFHKSDWIVKKQLWSFIDFHVRNGYEMYIEKEVTKK